MATCPAPDELVEPRLNRVLTQYRESPRLLHMIRSYLRQVEQVAVTICDLPSKFEISSATGDQLTLIGKRIGWPRCHCICVAKPVFGFECEDFPGDFPLAAFCVEGTWIDCGEYGLGDICIEDDEVYRGFLYSRLYQMLSLYDLASLTEAIRHIWGPTAMVLDSQPRRVVITPGRELTSYEQALLQLVPRVLPIALGIEPRFHFGPIEVFGFGTGWGGFCEEWEPEGLTFVTENGDTLETEEGIPLITGPLTRDADWMCAIDVKPYECAA